MYGVIHFVVKDMIVSQFGQEALDKILDTAGLQESQHFKMFSPYDDSVLEALLGATSKCLGLPVEMVLEVFGDYFITYCLRHGYDDMLRTLGSDMTSFIQNLDSLHSLLALSYEKMVAPSFRCDTNEDGSLTLHYHSTRANYHPLAKGLLCAVAREIFNQKIDISFVSSVREKVDEGRDQEHVIFHVTVVDQLGHKTLSDDNRQQETARTASECVGGQVDNVVAPVTLNKEQFASAFPYHLIFDENLRLQQYGGNVARLSPIPLYEGMLITSAFRILYPRISFTVENIRRFINAIFIMAVKPMEGVANCSDGFSMKGQMMWMADTRLMIFIGSPRLTSLKEMKRMNVYMADIPLYDVTREMVLLYQQRSAEIYITKKLDETTAELKRMSRELELEKQRTDKLLYQMLPEKVANQLKNGQTVEAEKFDQVTVLFSDIVNFTTIAAACTPLEVVKMLNDLYHKFDQKTNEHGVYKVETIGDAYMVVSGVPDITDKHAQLVANFALDVVKEAQFVTCPHIGKPLQIRVGVHTGPVVAGVVGVKMPRYCLFGDTVNTASRMESHGYPGRIHISLSTFKCLHGQGYRYRARGEILIKGKGTMHTYFIIENQARVTADPDDEHLNLPVVTCKNFESSTVTKNKSPDHTEVKQHRHNHSIKDIDTHNTNIKHLTSNGDKLKETDTGSGSGGYQNGGPEDKGKKVKVKLNEGSNDNSENTNRVFTNGRTQSHTPAHKIGQLNGYKCVMSANNGLYPTKKASLCGFSALCENGKIRPVGSSDIPRDDSCSNLLLGETRMTNDFDNDVSYSMIKSHQSDLRKTEVSSISEPVEEVNFALKGSSEELDDVSRFSATVRNRRVSDIAVGRFHVHSKTCQLL